MSALHCPVVVSIPAESAEARNGEPVTIGIPLPVSWTSGDDLALRNADGTSQLCDTRVLDRWHDGSVRWVLLDFLASCAAGGQSEYRLEHSDPPKAASTVLAVTESRDTIVVDTGVLVCSVGRSGEEIVRQVEVNGRSVLDSRRSGFVLETETGLTHRPVVERAEVTHRGAVRATVRILAAIGRAGNPLLRLDIQLDFFRNLPTIRCTATVHNPRPAVHPGGIWELGSGGSVLFRDLSLELASASEVDAGAIRCSPEYGAPLESFSGAFTLYQDSSGGHNWQSSNHVNREGVIPVRLRGYALTARNEDRTGLRATPLVAIEGSGTMLAVTTQHFWQNFPKAVEADGSLVRLRLFPKQFGDLHEIQGGEQKTHVVSLGFARDAVTATPLEWARAPLFARCAPEWYCGTGVVPFLVPASSDPHQDLVAYQRAAIEGPHSFEAKREVIDEYGWRNFGDLYADHEAVLHKGPTPLVSHYNNQYDAVAGMAWQFFRTADERWWQAFLDLSSHVRDVDIYHTSGDRAAYNGGMFWHTYHYLDAGRSSHRSYPKAPGVAGGGPANEHDYSNGLVLRYFLTGQVQFRETVIELAEWVINMDDGRQHVLRWITSAPTGLASSTGNPLYHGPGRGPAYSIQTLLNAHQLTGKPQYIGKAEELLRRCIHPDDDIDALNLLDAERRWYYTVFLQALGGYLLYKERLDDLDRTYWYGRLSLVRYAGWMAEHEYPYLEKPEILEYPTETWAAMDMRKSEVFCHAARYVEGKERERFLDRAGFFSRYSVTTLRQSPTAYLTRPMVVLLTNGCGYSHVTATGVTVAPQAGNELADFASPARFVPQRLIATQRLTVAGAGLAVVGVLVLWLARM